MIAYAFIKYVEEPHPVPGKPPQLRLKAWNDLVDSDMQTDEWNGARGGGVIRNIQLDNGWNLVKIRARAELLQALAASADVRRIPNRATLDETLADLSNAQRTAITDFLEQELGISRGDWRAALGNNIGTRTLGQLLRFITGRGQRTRVFDGQHWSWTGPSRPLPDPAMNEGV